MIQIVIILVVLLAGGGFGAWTYMEKLQADNRVLQVNQEILKENELKLNDAIAEQQAVIAEKAKQAEDIQTANAALRAETSRLNSEKDNLAKKLGKHELDILAQNKPGLVNRIINRASDNVMRCFEILSGSPLTHDELQADKPSLYNRECPTIHPKHPANQENTE
jgi:hypothetical protein|tara:strand:+ start:103 stop:597 length:495 start_codon:yes stop_codon:yes gene_type:complete